MKEEPKLVVLDNELSANYPFKILVVDDNEINLMLITKTLSKLGYECKKASNGQIAVDMVTKEHFDLIFMDMQMPIMDGTVATTEIRKHYRVYEFPVVVALTANTLGDGKDKCLEAGMQDFIAKPFKPAEIEEVIKKWAPKIIDYKSKHQSNSLS
ncbi:Sensor histidine kinase RcsC [compost metagenome]